MKTIEEIKIEIMLKVLAGEDLEWDYLKTLPKNDELRTFICSLKPCYAYWYAEYVDKEPRDDTREASCKDPWSAYLYARYVDKCPRDDTRKSACGSPLMAYGYAREVDKRPRGDTREAAYRNPYHRKIYVERFGE